MLTVLKRYGRCLRQVHFDFHTPDSVPDFLSRFSIDDFIQTLRDAHVQGIRFFAKCHHGNSYYFTDLGKRHPQLSFDLLMEVAQACREHGILCYAYYNVLANRAAGHKHPEWRERTDTGQDFVYPSYIALCPNTPYVEELLLPQLEELMRYPLDGFFLDMTYFTADAMTCFCDSCRKQFKDQTGLAMSKELFLSQPELRCTFRYRSVLNMMKKVVRLRDRLAPDKILIANHAGVDEMFQTDHSKGPDPDPMDVGCVEVQPCRMGNYLLAEHFGRYLRPQGRPFEIVPVRFVFGWGESTLKPLAQMNYENSLIVSHGGVIAHGDHLPPDGQVPQAVYRRLGQSFAFIRQREPFILETNAVSYAAVLSRASSIYWNRAVLGAERILGDLHIQTDVLERRTLRHLDRYKVLVLPDRSENRRGPSTGDGHIFPIPRLLASEVRIIRDWLAAGGRLIASGNALSSEGSGDLTEEMLGVRVDKPDAEMGYLYAENESLPENHRGFGCQVRVPFHRVHEREARRVLDWRRPMVLKDSSEHFNSPYPPMGRPAETAAVFGHRLGKGQVLYFAFPIFLDYNQTGHTWLKEIFAHLTKDLFADRPMIVDGVPSLRTNLRQAQDGTLYLDLLYAHPEQVVNQFPMAGILQYPVIETEYPLNNVRIVMPGVRAKSVSLEPGGRTIPWRQDGPNLALTIPEVRTYDIVQIKAESVE